MKEIISIGVGNFGLSICENFTKEIAEEHNINLDGTTKDGFNDSLHYPNIFFEEC